MQDPRTLRERAEALADLGRHREAEAQFRAALAGAPDDGMALSGLAYCTLRQSRPAESAELARQSLAHGYDRRAVLVLALSLSELGRPHDGLAVVDQGLQVAPDDPGLHHARAALFGKLGNWSAALGSAQHAISLDPFDADHRGMAAAALLNLGRPDEAETQLAEALRLDPENADAHRLSGQVQLRRGGGRTAVDSHREAVRLDPQDELNREALGVALKARNPLYGWLLRLQMWLGSQPTGLRWFINFVPLILLIQLRPYLDQWPARVLYGLVIVVVVLTWTLEPLMNLVLLAGRRTRGLLPQAATRSTLAFVAFVLAALGCAGLGWSTGRDAVSQTALGFAMWAAPVGLIHLARESRQRAWSIAAAAAFAFGLAAAAAGWGGSSAMPTIFMFSGVIALWTSSLTN